MHESPVQMIMKLVSAGKTHDEIVAAVVAQGTKPDMAERLASIFLPASSGGTLPGSATPATTASPTTPTSTPSPPADTPKPVVAPPLPVSAPSLSPPRSTSLSSWAAKLPVRPGWLFVAAVSLIPVIAMLVDTSLAGRFGTFSLTLITLGDITGVIGLALYALNMLLATRMAWLEDLFGGLNKVFISHHILGGLALIMILIHPILTAVSYYPYGLHTVAFFFVPQAAYIGTAFGIFALLLTIGLLILTFFVKMGYKVWLLSHKYLGVAYLLIGLHIILTPNRITADPFVHWYLIGLVALGIGAFTYRTLLPNVFVRRYVYTVKAVTPKGVGVIEVSLAPIDRPAYIKPGQFVFIAFDTDGLSTEWHPFTVSSREVAGSFTLDIKSLGAYTETLTRLLPNMVGMTAHIEGAYGRFSYHNFENINQIWIAGGIGITPFLSMAQDLGPGPYNIDLYYSVKTESELIDIQKLAAEQTNKPGQVFRVFPFVADTYHSFLSADIISSASGDLKKRDFLICGPPVMMQSITKQLTKLGVSRRQIHSEEFSLE